MGQWRGKMGGGLDKDSKHERQISSARVQAMNKLNLWEAGFLCIVRRYVGAVVVVFFFSLSIKVKENSLKSHG